MGKGIYGKGGYKSFDEMMDRARRAEFIPFDDIAEDKMIEEGGSFHCSAIDYPAHDHSVSFRYCSLVITRAKPPRRTAEVTDLISGCLISVDASGHPVASIMKSTK